MLVECGGESLLLCADRALYWPARRTLLVADTHFGKAGVFRQAGVPIPEGIDAHDLARLSALITGHTAQRLIVLGDFFHGRPESSGAFLDAFAQWLDQHRRLSIDVVAGNHDRHGGTGRWTARIRWHAAGLLEPPFLFSHAPTEHADAYVLCGHLHPVVNLHSGSGDHARLPAFRFAPRCATLPAFGRFTGGYAVRAEAEDRLFVIAEDEVLALGTA